MLRLILFLSCLGLVSGAQAVQRYQSTLDKSSWRVKSSPISCEMVHEISHYGDARFVYSSGGELAFQLRVLQASPRNSVASLHSIAPFWREQYEKELAQLTLSEGRMPIYLGGSIALRMFYELQAGRNPTFHYKDWADMQDDVYVSVSSVNFHQKIDSFQRCMSQALPYGADQVKDTVIHFPVNKHAVSKAQRKKLNEIVLFAKTDTNLMIQLNGHADGDGRRRYNQKLSLRRTQAVEKYLLKQGIPESQITTKAFGEGRPVGSNRSERGRKSNRRVDVVILRN